MVTKVNQTNTYGTEYFSWEFSEFERPQRLRSWYIGAAIIGVALIVYSIITNNLLFALIVLMLGFILIVREYTEPGRVFFGIFEDGIILGKRFYPYKELAEFYIIYEPPRVKRLYVKPKFGTFKLSIPIFEQDPVAIRDILLKYLKEDTESEYESIGDSLEQILKL